MPRDRKPIGESSSETLAVLGNEARTVVLQRPNSGNIDDLLGRIEKDIALERKAMDELLTRLRKIAG